MTTRTLRPTDREDIAQRLLRSSAKASYDPLTEITSHVQYSYTEIADECRHSVMFARFITKMGAPYYQLDPVSRFLGRVFKATSNGPLTFSAALFVEELLDQMQREAMTDEQVEPLTRAVARLHVTEEARHMRYAREELIRDWPRRGAVTRAYSRIMLALAAARAADNLVSPDCYARVGLDPKQARRAARRNPHWRASKIWFARQAVETFSAAGLLCGTAMYIWRRAGLIEPTGSAGAAVGSGRPGVSHDA